VAKLFEGIAGTIVDAESVTTGAEDEGLFNERSNYALGSYLML